MAKQNMNTSAITATESAPSLEVEQVETVPMVEQVEEAVQAEPAKVDVKSMPTGTIVQAILSSTFAPDARLTGYKIHSVINVAFQILQIVDEKTGAILKITPQMIYNATKLRKDETYDLIRTLEFVTRYVQRRRDGQVAQGARVAEATLMANALKALS